jgi:acyl carrier protein
MITKLDLKRLIVRLLEEETGDDLSDLAHRIELDVTCDERVDSLSMVNIAIDLEKALGIRIDDVEITPERVRSLDAFSDVLLKKVSVAAAEASALGDGPGRHRETAVSKLDGTSPGGREVAAADTYESRTEEQ